MPGHADGTVAVVIPAYQAAATIGGVVTAAKRALPAATIYVVDDGSRDQTGEGGRGKGATVLVHPRNLGKGAALRTGIDRALYDGRPSHFRHWEDTWRLARVFTRYGRRIILGAR